MFTLDEKRLYPDKYIFMNLIQKTKQSHILNCHKIIENNKKNIVLFEYSKLIQIKNMKTYKKYKSSLKCVNLELY